MLEYAYSWNNGHVSDRKDRKKGNLFQTVDSGTELDLNKRFSNLVEWFVPDSSRIHRPQRCHISFLTRERPGKRPAIVF